MYGWGLGQTEVGTGPNPPCVAWDADGNCTDYSSAAVIGPAGTGPITGLNVAAGIVPCPSGYALSGGQCVSTALSVTAWLNKNAMLLGFGVAALVLVTVAGGSKR